MDGSHVNLEKLALRVHALEKQNHRWKMVSLLALLLLAFSLTSGVRAQGRNGPNLLRANSVEAQGFVLKDLAGNVRAALRMKDDRPVLELYDSFGRIVWSTPAKAGPIPLS